MQWTVTELQACILACEMWNKSTMSLSYIKPETTKQKTRVHTVGNRAQCPTAGDADVLTASKPTKNVKMIHAEMIYLSASKY